MRTLLVRLIAVLGLLIGALAIIGAPPVTAAGLTVQVNAYADYNRNANPPTGDPNSVWTNTGFTLQAGQPVTITASGTADRGSGATDPNGIGSCGGCVGAGLPVGSLIGRIGTGPIFLVGAGPTTVSGVGTLYLAFNDGLYTDNSGFFTATIAAVAGPATTIAAYAGNNQSAAVGSPYPAPLQAKVTDQFGTPVPGVPVTFTTTGVAATAAFPGGQRSATATTDANGIATSPRLVAAGTAGQVRVVASTPGVATTATFTLVNGGSGRDCGTAAQPRTYCA